MKFYIVFIGLISHFALTHDNHGVAYDLERAVVLYRTDHTAQLMIADGSFENPSDAAKFLGGGVPDKMNGHPVYIYSLKGARLRFNNLPPGLPHMPEAIPSLEKITVGKKPLSQILEMKEHPHTCAYIDYTGSKVQTWAMVDRFKWKTPSVPDCQPYMTKPPQPEGSAVTVSYYSVNLTGKVKASITDLNKHTTFVLKRNAMIFVSNMLAKNAGHKKSATGDYKDHRFLMTDGKCIAEIPDAAIDKPHFTLPAQEAFDDYLWPDRGSIRNPECTNTQYP